MSSQPFGAKTECRDVNDLTNNTISVVVNNAPSATTPSTSDIKGVWHNLKAPVSSFTGRLIQLTEIQNVLQPEKKETSTSRCAVIIGVGGTGKTELARKYVELNSVYYKNIVWVDSETPANISSTFASVAKDQLGVIKDDGNCCIEVTVTKVYEHLSQSKTLFIFDKAEGFQTIQPFLPPLIKRDIKNIHILFTSQIKEWEVMDEDDVTPIYLHELLPEEAKEFVKKSLKQNDVPDDDIDKLIIELAFFPLALTQAVCYINQQQKNTKLLSNTKTYGIADYLIEFRHQAVKLLNHPINNIHHRYAKTVYQNVELILNKVSKEKDGKNAVELISIIAYFAPDDIYVGGDQNVALLLHKYSVIELNGGVASIHRLLQQVIRLRNRKNELAFLRKTLSVLRKIDQADDSNYLGFHVEVHVMFVWNYAIEHDEFIRNFASYTYGYEKFTPIHIFAWNNNYEGINSLLKKLHCKESRKICKYRDGRGQTPLHLIVDNSHALNIVKLLIDHGSGVNAKDVDGSTPLHKSASWNKNLDVTKFLVERGSDINARDENGETPLHRAAYRNRNSDVTKFLIERGSDVNAKDKEGETPLHKAAWRKNLDVIKFLIERGSDVNAKDENGSTPLHKAAYWNQHLDVIKFLVERGLDVNAKNKNDETPLHKAAYRNRNSDVTKFLIERGSDINAKDKEGETPLHKAHVSKNQNIIKYLVDHGAKDYSNAAYKRMICWIC